MAMQRLCHAVHSKNSKKRKLVNLKPPRKQKRKDKPRRRRRKKRRDSKISERFMTNSEKNTKTI